MSQTSQAMDMPHISHTHAHGASLHVLRRTLIIGLTAFLTVVDLFATHAILPSLVRAYQVSPAAMGFAVNASTMRMAVRRVPGPFLTLPLHPPRRAGLPLTSPPVPPAPLPLPPHLPLSTPHPTN